MLPKYRASGSVTNGRGRATACLMVLQMKVSPSGRIKSSSRTQSRRRVPPFHSNPTTSKIRTGMKKALPLKTGMSQSKKGLTSDRLTKKNRLVSSACSQCIAASVAGTGKLETQLAPDWSSSFNRPGSGELNREKHKMYNKCNSYFKNCTAGAATDFTSCVCFTDRKSV